MAAAAVAPVAEVLADLAVAAVAAAVVVAAAAAAVAVVVEGGSDHETEQNDENVDTITRG